MFKMWMIGLLSLLLSGCVMSPGEISDEGRERTAHPVRYEQTNDDHDQVRVNDYGRELQKTELSTNEMDSYSDPTTTANTEAISKKLMENRDIIMAEVHEMEDQVYVAVKLRENTYGRSHTDNIIPFIEDSVKQLSDKQIIVWTDHIEWNEFKNDGAKREFFEKFDEFFFGEETDGED